MTDALRPVDAVHATDSPADRPDDPDDPLVFTPVPARRHRRGGWTLDRQLRFILALSRCGSVSAAARSVGLSARSAYKLLEREGADSFAAAWDHAAEAGRDRLRGDAFDRAIHGVVEPMIRYGREVGVRTRFDDRLALAVLAGRGAFPGIPRAEIAGNNRRRREMDVADARAEAGRVEEQALYDAELADMVRRGEAGQRAGRERVVSIRLL